jgi:hypothetical protein
VLQRSCAVYVKDRHEVIEKFEAGDTAPPPVERAYPYVG